MFRIFHFFITAFIISMLMPTTVLYAARIKDIADLKGVRENQLVGYGLIVGLNDTGDTDSTGFTMETVANMLENLGITVDRDDIDVGNVAAVMVTAALPSFAKCGVKIDVTVSSLGDAESLLGGTLLRTPLMGPDGKVYAVAQGPVLVGGFSFGGSTAKMQKNHPTVGRIPDGALVENEVSFSLPQKGDLVYHLHQSDFTTTSRMVSVINAYFGQDIAIAEDSGSVIINMPNKYNGRTVQFVSELERLELRPDARARVVINEKTGTIVMGEDVRLSKVAISHGNLKLVVKERIGVSQPLPFSQGETVLVPETESMEVEEDKGRMMVMDRGVTLGEVAAALNAIGATPHDLITIFQSIKAAGALHAELVIL
jgi:flagellar P-ring protein precursor FlgI